ncbi:copper homeostasis protein CutC [Erysipelothrix anatis]|uniref:copper homeostasis protein CutC n=1 Tax=Erysipelothrix anatis TaxID=2683713 RepID=UPI0019150B98|nr:copper homeostasis protein CutC [Erysipelothrix anatis]
MKIKVEVCAGSVQDCIVAQAQGADRIELNNALFLGGLTPSVATLTEAKKHVEIPIITMVRARAGGFHYTDVEMKTMFEDAKILIEYGTDGIVFGFLNADNTIDEIWTKVFVDLAREHGIEAIYHRAFDRTPDAQAAIEALIRCGIDRVLTSGLETTADKGIPTLKMLQENYGTQIEICVGAGVNAENINEILDETKVTQVHSSFIGWFNDPTTSSSKVSYRYDQSGDYEGVDAKKLQTFMEVLVKRVG